MYIIAGLGNPGTDYEHTRHNIGFTVIDYIGDRLNININRIKFKGLYGDGLMGSSRVVLLKPQTYMNLSGQSILDIVQFYKIELNNLIVVYDDASIPMGRIRIRPSGSDGGHNGMKSIIYLLGNNGFPRLRVGIGSPEINMVDHVLGRPAEDEQKIINDVVKVSSEAIMEIVENGIVPAMNKYNGYRHGSIAEEPK